jgi:hypothetical protein
MLVYQRVREHFNRNQETIDFPMKYWGLNHNKFPLSNHGVVNEESK